MGTERRRRSFQELYVDHRFAVLLVILVILLVGTPLAMELKYPVWWLDGLMSILLLLSIFPLCFERRERVFALALGLPSVLISVAGNAFSGSLSLGVLLAGRLCEILFLFGAAMLIVRSLFEPHKASFDSVFGAVCGYLFLGLGWTCVFLLIEAFQPGSYQINQTAIPAGERVRPLTLELSYYSFITLTTVGYGDVVPLTPVTRTLSWMEAIAGQFYLAVVVAGLVNSMGSPGGASKKDELSVDNS